AEACHHVNGLAAQRLAEFSHRFISRGQLPDLGCSLVGHFYEMNVKCHREPPSWAAPPRKPHLTPTAEACSIKDHSRRSLRCSGKRVRSLSYRTDNRKPLALSSELDHARHDFPHLE